MARSGDPMSGLLSGLGGIDPSLFQRPQAMKDMKGNAPHKSAELDRPTALLTQQLPPQDRQQAGTGIAMRSAEQNKPASDKQFRPAMASPPGKNAFADKDFGNLLADGNFSKGGRPMRPAARTAPSASAPASDWTIDTHSAKSEALSEASALSPAASYTTQQSAGLPVPDDPFQYLSQPAAQQQGPNGSSADPFDVFGAWQARQAQQPACPPAPGAVDLLQGFGDARGMTDHGAVSDPALPSASPADKFFDLPPPSSQPSASKALQSPPAATPATQPSRGAGALQSRQSTAEQLSPARPLPDSISPPANASSQQHRSQPGRQQQQQQQQQSRPAGRREPQEQPASYWESVGRQAAASPEQPQKRADDWQRPPLSGSRERRQQAPAAAASIDDGYGYDIEPVRRGVQQRQDQGQDGEGAQPQVPVWLASSQKWLKSAGKKVAQAAKETTAQLQARLEEFEGRPVRGGAERANSVGPGGTPEYFQDWAARLEGMPPDRAASMLEALSEQDRLAVQRIMDEHVMERAPAQAASPRSNGPLSSRSRRSEAASRSGTVMTSPQSFPDSPRSFEEDSQQAEAMSRDLHAALSSPRKSMQRKDSDALSTASSSQAGSRGMSRKALDPGTVPGSTSRSGPPQQQGSPSKLGPSPDALAQRSQPQPESASADFLGFSGDAQLFRQSAPAADLMGMDNGCQADDMFTIPARQQQAAVDDLDIFGSPKASRAPPSTQTSGPADIFSQLPQRVPAAAARPQAPARAAPPSGMMMDFGGEGAPAANVMSAAGDLNVEGEPELRRELRAQRLARTQARMQEQLAEKQARDAQEESNRHSKGDLRTAIRPRMDAWQSGKKDNIRALLASLDTVLWEGSGWTKPGMADLVDKGRVKRAYMRANLIVHPDKVAQKGGTLEQVVIADMAFDALKTAWAKFEAGELRA